MIKRDHQKAQAAAELAVFGAVLIFLIGSIVRTAVGNSYTQDQNFQAMRLALLESWNGSQAGITAYNSASVIFLDDRLTQDFNKYGDLERTPYMTMGSGSFTYEMFYPLSGAQDYTHASPVQDIYINGQHFPFAQALYTSAFLYPPGGGSPACTGGQGQANAPYTNYPLSQQQCLQNRCFRNAREWVNGGGIKENFLSTADYPGIPPIFPTAPSFTGYVVPSNPPISCKSQACQEEYDSAEVFQELACNGWIVTNPAWTSQDCTNDVSLATSPTVGTVSPLFVCSGYGTNPCIMPAASSSDQFIQSLSNWQLTQIENILQQAARPQKLFYGVVTNAGGPTFPVPPTVICPNGQPGCGALTTGIKTLNAQGVLGFWNGIDPKCSTTASDYSTADPTCDHYGDMMFDLSRNAYYATTPPPTVCAYPPCTVEGRFPVLESCALPTSSASTPLNMRCYIAWRWGAQAATSAIDIGLVTTEGAFPQYDIDGRLKEVTIYTFSLGANGAPAVSYLDPELGDIDPSWDANSCGPKPGIQSEMQIYTYTQDGTYLLINEGKLFNPETGQVVRSANKRDNVDLISRSIQLTNNTGRFCTIACTDGSTCGAITANRCKDHSRCTTTDTADPPHPCGSEPGDSGCATVKPEPPPVEVCVDESAADNGCNCFMGSTTKGPQNPKCGFTLAQTCYDTSINKIFVRSRIQDLRGRFWLTNASGQLGVK